MLIFGWRTRSTVRDTGAFSCPVCQSERQYVIVDQQRWFTLFFIPIIPLGRFGEQLQCSGCGTTFDPAILQRSTPNGVIQAQLVSGLTATSPLGENPNHAGYVPGTSPFPSRTDGRPTPSTTTTSGLSIGSLISGSLSPLLVVTCFGSLVSSVIAIITGHLALGAIRRSGGRVRGKWQAITGLTLGYLSLALTFAMIVYLGTRLRGAGEVSSPDPAMASATGAVGNTPKERLKHAEYLVAAKRGQELGFGNHAQAQQLAEQFATRMKATDEKLFTQTRSRIVQLSGGEFLTYCELHADRCALIVHVPSYRDYTSDAKELLATAAWYVAADLASDKVAPGSRLAVALRGSLLYGDVLTGVVDEDSDEDSDDDPPFSRRDSEVLLTFFAAPSAANVTDRVVAIVPNEDRSGDATNATEIVDHTTSTSRNMSPEVSSNGQSPLAQPANPPSQVAQRDAAQEPTDTTLPEVDSSTIPPARRRERPTPRAEPPMINKVPVELIWQTPAQGWNIQAMAFSADARWLALGRIDQHVSMHEVATGREVFTSERLEKLGPLVALAFAHDGQHLLAGGASGATCAFAFDSSGQLGEPQYLYRHARDASCVVTSPRHRFTVSGGRDGTVAWEPFGGQASPPRILQTLDRQVLAVFLPSEGSTATATDGRSLIQFDLRTAQELDRQTLQKSSTQAAAFRADGQRLAVCLGSEIQVFDTQSGGLVQTLASPDRQMAWSVAYLPQANWLISGGRGSATLWDVDAGERLANIDLGGVLYVQTLTTNSDGTLLAAVPSAAGQSVRLFRIPK